jgi:hypothetical protein
MIGSPRFSIQAASILNPTASVPVNGSTTAVVETQNGIADRSDAVACILRPRHDGRRPHPRRRADSEDHAAQGVQRRRLSNAFDIERAIYYAVDHGAKVINMSFSSVTTSAELTHAIDYASMHGVICLASAGNSGKRSVVFPAGYRNVMAIGSTTAADQRSAFSNHGDHLVKLAAPGEALITLVSRRTVPPRCPAHRSAPRSSPAARACWHNSSRTWTTGSRRATSTTVR